MRAEALPSSTQIFASDDVVQRVGHLIRMLRETMRELGLDKEIEKAAMAIPDARDRLSYIGSMTEKAAERALNAIDRAQPLQDKIGSCARALNERWQSWSDDPARVHDSKLVEETRSYLRDVPSLADATNKELLEIMMAQDFQDLTGQVLKKMVDVIRGLEFQLLQVVLDNVPPEEGREELQRRADELKQSDARREATLLNGPQINPNQPDVVSNQDQVDDLLADLGF